MSRQLVGVGLVLVGFVLEATSIISHGRRIRFRAALRPLLLIALIATLAMWRQAPAQSPPI